MEINKTGENVQPEARGCPHLGLRDDPATALSYPSSHNCCFHARPITPVKLEHQGTCCLTINYTNCEEHNREPGSRLPANLRYHARDSGRGKTSSRTGLWALLLVFVVIALAVWQILARGLFGFANLRHPTSTEMSTSSVAPIQGQDAATLATLLLTPTPTLSTKTLTPTIGSAHALETPIGLENKFIIHRVLAGESLVSLANRHGTTIEAIQAVNYKIPNPVWVDWLVVIPLNRTDVRGLPAFEAYLVKTNFSAEALAQYLSVDPILFKQYNALKDAEVLGAGEWVLVPHMGTATP